MGKEQDEDDECDFGPATAVKPRKRARRTDEQRARNEAWRQLIHIPIPFASNYGSERSKLCERRIKDAMNWFTYLKLIEECRQANPTWKPTKVKHWVQRYHFGSMGILEERSDYYRMLIERSNISLDGLDLEEAIATAKRDYFGRVPKREVKQREALKDADEVFAGLPVSAAIEDEWAWVRAHGRWFELGQCDEDPDKDPLRPLSPDDIKGAPSRGAVTLLQGALRDPKDFRRQVNSEGKKSTGKPTAELHGDEWGDDESGDGDDDFDLFGDDDAE